MNSKAVISSYRSLVPTNEAYDDWDKNTTTLKAYRANQKPAEQYNILLNKHSSYRPLEIIKHNSNDSATTADTNISKESHGKPCNINFFDSVHQKFNTSQTQKTNTLEEIRLTIVTPDVKMGH